MSDPATESRGGFRLFTDDAQRLAFWISVYVGIPTVTAGISWNYWASLWDVALVLRVPVAMSVATMVMLWVYFALCITHSYWRWPKLNPRLVLQPPPIQQAVSPTAADGLITAPAQSLLAPIETNALEISAYNGITATVGVKNNARSFKLLVRGRIAECSLPVKRNHPYEISRRELKSGDTDTIQIAAKEKYEDHVSATDAMGHAMDTWKDLNSQANFSLTLVIEFLEVGPTIRTITSRTYVIVLNKDKTQLKIKQ
jgi:hypothetical protein